MEDNQEDIFADFDQISDEGGILNAESREVVQPIPEADPLSQGDPVPPAQDSSNFLFDEVPPLTASQKDSLINQPEFAEIFGGVTNASPGVEILTALEEQFKSEDAENYRDFNRTLALQKTYGGDGVPVENKELTRDDIQANFGDINLLRSLKEDETRLEYLQNKGIPSKLVNGRVLAQTTNENDEIVWRFIDSPELTTAKDFFVDPVAETVSAVGGGIVGVASSTVTTPAGGLVLMGASDALINESIESAARYRLGISNSLGGVAKRTAVRAGTNILVDGLTAGTGKLVRTAPRIASGVGTVNSNGQRRINATKKLNDKFEDDIMSEIDEEIRKEFPELMRVDLTKNQKKRKKKLVNAKVRSKKLSVNPISDGVGKPTSQNIRAQIAALDGGDRLMKIDAESAAIMEAFAKRISGANTEAAQKEAIASVANSMRELYQNKAAEFNALDDSLKKELNIKLSKAIFDVDSVTKFTGVEDVELGKGVAEGFLKIRKQGKEESKELFESATSNYGQIPAELGTREWAKGALKLGSFKTQKPPVYKVVNGVKKKVRSKTVTKTVLDKEAVSMLKDVLDLGEFKDVFGKPTSTIAELRNLRTQVGNMVENGNTGSASNISNSTLKGLYDSLSSDIDNAIAQIPDKAARKAFDLANETHKRKVIPFNNSNVSRILNSPDNNQLTGASLVDQLINGSPKSLDLFDTIDKIAEEFGDEAVEKFRGDMRNLMLHKVFGEGVIDTKTGDVDIGKFITTVSGLNKGTVRRLFGNRVVYDNNNIKQFFKENKNGEFDVNHLANLINTLPKDGKNVNFSEILKKAHEVRDQRAKITQNTILSDFRSGGGLKYSDEQLVDSLYGDTLEPGQAREILDYIEEVNPEGAQLARAAAVARFFTKSRKISDANQEASSNAIDPIKAFEKLSDPKISANLLEIIGADGVEDIKSLLDIYGAEQKVNSVFRKGGNIVTQSEAALRRTFFAKIMSIPVTGARAVGDAGKKLLEITARGRGNYVLGVLIDNRTAREQLLKMADGEISPKAMATILSSTAMLREMGFAKWNEDERLQYETMVNTLLSYNGLSDREIKQEVDGAQFSKDFDDALSEIPD